MSRSFVLPVSLTVLLPVAAWCAGSLPVFRTDVDLVMLSFTVTDDHGQYVTGLRSQDIKVLEDGIEQRIQSFIEQGSKAGSAKLVEAPNNIFVLFDTSNCMYDGF